MIPLAPRWVISKTRNVIARLTPDHARRRLDIEIASGVSTEEMAEATCCTIKDGDIIYTLDGETYRRKFNTIRGDFRRPDGVIENKLRPWDKADFMPRPDDVLQERLYCIQWTTKETLRLRRPETFFSSATHEDLDRELRVEGIVRDNLIRWQGGRPGRRHAN
jgi:putative DNA methylase